MSELKMNMIELKNVLKKASINYLVPGVSIYLDKERVWSNSISADNTAISFISLKNDIIKNNKEGFEFHFSDLLLNLKPYLDLISDEEVKIKILENKLTVKDSNKKSFNLFFCTEDFTNKFGGEDKSEEMDFFYNNKIEKSFVDKLNELKKIAFKFGKIYIIVEDGKFYIESTDRLNSFSNSVKIEIDEIENTDINISMCFDFKNLTHIISTIEDNIDNFRLKCTYLEEQSAGMILFESNDKSEKYFLTSKNE